MGKSDRNKAKKEEESQSTGSKLYVGRNNWEQKGLEYHLDESQRFTFKYVLDKKEKNQREIVYFHGKIKYEGEAEKEVSFIQYESKGYAYKIVDMGYGLNHYRVLKPLFATFDKDIGKSFVCFEKFQCLQPFCSQQDLAKFLNPNSNTNVPGNPTDDVKQEVKELAETLQFLHANGLSSSLLRVQVGYFWDGTKFKILADVDEQNKEKWIKIKKLHIQQFGEGINTILLSSRTYWPERDRFLICFSVSIAREDDRLSMIIDHPFLKNNIKEQLEFFSEIDHAIHSSEYNSRHGISKLCSMITSQGFDKRVLFKSGNQNIWLPAILGPSLQQVLFYQQTMPQPNTPLLLPFQSTIGKYDVTSTESLMRYLRNVFEHYYDPANANPFILATVFKEVNEAWPGLLHNLHVCSY